MKNKIFFIFICFLITSCYSPKVTTGSNGEQTVVTDENGNVVKELDVPRTCGMIRSVLGITLPLTIEKYFKGKQPERIKHTSDIVEAASDVLKYLDNDEEKTQESVEKVIKNFGKKLTSGERSAIQSGINLLLQAIKENANPNSNETGEKALDILKCLFDEARSIFKLYTVEEPVQPRGIPQPEKEVDLEYKVSFITEKTQELKYKL